MFKVMHKYDDKIEMVYDVKRKIYNEGADNEYADVEFLIYTNDNYAEMYKWTYVDAAYYEPM